MNRHYTIKLGTLAVGYMYRALRFRHIRPKCGKDINGVTTIDFVGTPEDLKYGLNYVRANYVPE